MAQYMFAKTVVAMKEHGHTKNLKEDKKFRPIIQYDSRLNLADFPKYASSTSVKPRHSQ